MVRKLLSLTAASAMTVASMALPAAPAMAQGYYGGGYGDGYYQQVRHDRRDYGRGYGGRGYGRGRGYDGYYGGRGYSDGYGRGYRGGRNDYRGGRGYGRCRDNGTGGTILGAIAGGLVGNGVAGYGDRTTGTVLGAGVGALAGRAIDRDC